MIIVSGPIHVAAVDRGRYLAACREVILAARASHGCIDFHLSADPIDSGRINVYEEWGRSKRWRRSEVLGRRPSRQSRSEPHECRNTRSRPPPRCSCCPSTARVVPTGPVTSLREGATCAHFYGVSRDSRCRGAGVSREGTRRLRPARFRTGRVRLPPPPHPCRHRRRPGSRIGSGSTSASSASIASPSSPRRAATSTIPATPTRCVTVSGCSPGEPSLPARRSRSTTASTPSMATVGRVLAVRAPA